MPTRNEAAHVEPFVERVEAALAVFPIDWRAEVIDASDDDTPSILRRLARRGAPFEVTQRPGKLGEAVRAGLGSAHGEILCVIDADLQHPPEILPDLLAPIILGRADICVGSRYGPGGSAAGLQSRWRRLAARASGLLVRWLFPATRLTSDPGSGLFAVRREALTSTVLRPRGSRVLAEILVRARWQTICDVPYRLRASDDGTVHLGTAAGVILARELISLWWLQRRLSAETRQTRLAKNLENRRRVAPVHPELLSHPPIQQADGIAEDSIHSTEPI